MVGGLRTSRSGGEENGGSGGGGSGGDTLDQALRYTTGGAEELSRVIR